MGIFTQIHEILFHGQGGYDYKTVYSMPLWLRKFTFHQLKTYYENQTGENDSSKYLVNEGVNMKDAPKAPVPDVVQKAASSYKVPQSKPKK